MTHLRPERALLLAATLALALPTVVRAAGDEVPPPAGESCAVEHRACELLRGAVDAVLGAGTVHIELVDRLAPAGLTPTVHYASADVDLDRGDLAGNTAYGRFFDPAAPRGPGVDSIIVGDVRYVRPAGADGWSTTGRPDAREDMPWDPRPALLTLVADSERADRALSILAEDVPCAAGRCTTLRYEVLDLVVRVEEGRMAIVRDWTPYDLVIADGLLVRAASADPDALWTIVIDLSRHGEPMSIAAPAEARIVSALVDALDR